MSRRIELLGELFKLGFSFKIVSIVVSVSLAFLAITLGFSEDELTFFYIIAIPLSLAAWVYIYDYAERKFNW